MLIATPDPSPEDQQACMNEVLREVLRNCDAGFTEAYQVF
jgi:hypothetical protein